jgi:hypothetical protein
MKKIFTYAGVNVPAPKSLVFFIRLKGYFLETLNMLYIGEACPKVSVTHTKDSSKIFHMDIQQQKEIFLKWIRSCQTAEQLDLLSQRVTEFVVERFSDKMEYYEMELTKEELSDAIIEQRVITARERRPMRLNTHLLIIPNEMHENVILDVSLN